VRDGQEQVARRRPAGFLAIPALVAPVAVCGIPGHASSGTQLAGEVAVLALIVGVVGFESTVSVGLVAVGTSLLSLNGFAEDAYGQLGWHPVVDLRAAAVLGAALALACAARRGVDRVRPEPPPESHVHAMTSPPRPAHDRAEPD
jgi:hypothetical protein